MKDSSDSGFCAAFKTRDLDETFVMIRLLVTGLWKNESFQNGLRCEANYTRNSPPTSVFQGKQIMITLPDSAKGERKRQLYVRNST